METYNEKNDTTPQEIPNLTMVKPKVVIMPASDPAEDNLCDSCQ